MTRYRIAIWDHEAQVWAVWNHGGPWKRLRRHELNDALAELYRRGWDELTVSIEAADGSLPPDEPQQVLF